MNSDELAIFNFAKIAFRLCQTNPRPCSRFTLRFFKKDKAYLFMRRTTPYEKIYDNDSVVTSFIRPISDEFFDKLKELTLGLMVPYTNSWAYSYNYAIQGREKRITFLTDDRQDIYKEFAGDKNADRTITFDKAKLDSYQLDFIKPLNERGRKRVFEGGEEYYLLMKDPSKNLNIHFRNKLLEDGKGVYNYELEKLYAKLLESLEEQREMGLLAV